MWTVNSPMSECMEVLLKKMSLPAHILDQEFGNIWKYLWRGGGGGGGGGGEGNNNNKKTTLHHHETRARYSRKAITETKQTGDIHNC